MDSGFFMSVARDLGAVLDFAEQPLPRLDIFTDHIPQTWISTAATLAEKATIRRRSLPSDSVLWLVVGMALFRGEPIVEVARRLNICAEGLANEVLLAKSGLHRRVSAWAISLCNGYFDSAPMSGDTSVTRKTTGMGSRFLP